MARQAVESTGAPKPIGPYSQAMAAGNLVFTSGQVGLDPVTGNLVPGGIETETRQAFANLAAVLAAAGSSFDRVLRVGIYLRDLADFARVNELSAAYFKPPFPARTTVGGLALPKGARVEIDLVAER